MADVPTINLEEVRSMHPGVYIKGQKCVIFRDRDDRTYRVRDRENNLIAEHLTPEQVIELLTRLR
jgi:hypothetical protein